jgi:hypothetical protein
MEANELWSKLEALGIDSLFSCDEDGRVLIDGWVTKEELKSILEALGDE